MSRIISVNTSFQLDSVMPSRRADYFVPVALLPQIVAASRRSLSCLPRFIRSSDENGSGKVLARAVFAAFPAVVGRVCRTRMISKALRLVKA